MTKKIPKCPLCGGPHYKYMCFKNPKRGKTLARKYKKAYATGKVNKHDKVLVNQTLDRKRLIMELDRYCSLIVRIGASNKYGICSCYTCGKRVPFKLGDNGHYRSRQAMQTRWDFQNCHFQCTTCLTGDATLYKWDFSPIQQRNIKSGDMILARNPMSNGVMIVKVEDIEPVEVSKTKTIYIDGEKIEGNFGHLIETRNGFEPIEKVQIHNIIRIWKK